MIRQILIGLMCTALIGCQVSTAPTRVSQLDEHHGVGMMRAPWNGEYTLYRLPLNGRGKRTVIQTARLRKDEPLGFRQREAGAVAVAGELEVPVSDGKYEWIMEADKGQTNWLATTGLVALISAVVVGALIGALYIAVDQSFGHSI